MSLHRNSYRIGVLIREVRSWQESMKISFKIGFLGFWYAITSKYIQSVFLCWVFLPLNSLLAPSSQFTVYASSSRGFPIASLVINTSKLGITHFLAHFYDCTSAVENFFIEMRKWLVLFQDPIRALINHGAVSVIMSDAINEIKFVRRFSME